MVTSMDDVQPEGAPVVQAAPVQGQPENTAGPTELQDPYAEAELRLRHERTERFIQRASRELT